METYKGMKVFNQGQYMTVYMPNHHRAYKNGTVYVHILQMEEKLGRLLKDGEVVHHNDRNKYNNSFENLTCFRSNEDHVSFHGGGKLIENEDGSFSCERVNKKKRVKRYTCPVCGKDNKTKNSKMCKRCSLGCKPRKSKLSDLQREELKDLIRVKSFLEIGRMFGCSDNGIRKRCKKLNLPYKAIEIKKMTKEEWELV